MKCLTTLIVTILLSAPGACLAGTGEPDDQLWTELDVVAPLSGSISITGIGQLRMSETLANPILTALGADANYKTGEWTLSLGYRHDLTGDREGEDIKVTQLGLLMGTWARRFGRSTFEVRARFEDTIDATSNPWRARLRGEYRWATPEWGRVSFIYSSDEVFYRFYDGKFWRNRFQAGCNMVIGRHAGLKLYYQRQDSRTQTPGAINALGVLAVINLD